MLGLAWLPEGLAYRSIAAVGQLYYLSSKRRQGFAMRFLRRAFPVGKTDRELNALARRSTGNFVKVSLDLILARRRLQQAPLEHYVEGLDSLREILCGGPVLVVSGHLGSWEAGAMAIANTVPEAHVITRPLKNPLVRHFIENSRKSLGLHIHSRRGGIRAISRALEAGAVGIQAVDQNQRLRGVFAPFFGKLASTERAAATLAVRKGYPVAICFCPRVGHGFRFRAEISELIQPETPLHREDTAVAVMRLVRRINKALEEAILRHPEQYLWIHDRYRTQPEGAEPTPDYDDAVPAAVTTGY
jgi:KDO2-lipid IV(A) lauroyltransferase